MEDVYENGYEAGYKAGMKDEEKQHCIFTDAVICNPDTGNCEACGWNPKVANARLNKMIYARKLEKKSTK